jgi:hypothetical protein
MKPKKIIGAVLALALVAGVVTIFVVNKNPSSPGDTPGSSNAASLTTVTGVIGSEKKPFFEDARVKKALAAKGLRVDVETAGSRQIATDIDLKSYDFAFPSSAPAAQKIQDKTKVSNVYSPFYSPMAIATYKPVMELLAKNGVATQSADKVWHIDMAAYLKLVSSGKRWNDLTGAAALYNSPRSILISSTDIRKSNSAAMYLSIASYSLNGNNVVSTAAQEKTILPNASQLFLAQGFSASSSEEPFQDYLSQGIGALPMVMIYESQFVGEASQKNSKITNQMVLAYPDPTVFSKHTLIPFNKKADKLGEALTTDPTLIQLEADYGFRTPDPKVFADVAKKNGVVVQDSITNIADTPSYDVLEDLITSISNQYDISGK